ncbi:MAG: PH domain-containing protein [Bradyrhizobiaceae bacterium]|nr:MAG: PH domain-containing protein [Bradyrhizobiaceae bacterium]
MDQQSINGFENEIATIRPSTIRWMFGSLEGWSVLLFCFVLVGLPVLAIIWIAHLCTKFTITNQRVKIAKGIIFRTVDEVELYRIKDVRVDYSLLNQLFNIGTVTIHSSDLTSKGGSLQLRCIADARAVRENLRNLVEQSRRNRGVRELDLDRVG